MYDFIWRCYNLSGTFCKLLDEDVTTYQEHLASYLGKMLQRSRKALLTMQTAGRYYTPQKMCKSYNSPAPPWAPSPKNVTSPWLLLSRSKAGGWKTSKLARSVRSIFHVYINCIYIYVLSHTRTYISVYHINIILFFLMCHDLAVIPVDSHPTASSMGMTHVVQHTATQNCHSLEIVWHILSRFLEGNLVFFAMSSFPYRWFLAANKFTLVFFYSVRYDP